MASELNQQPDNLPRMNELDEQIASTTLLTACCRLRIKEVEKAYPQLVHLTVPQLIDRLSVDVRMFGQAWVEEGKKLDGKYQPAGWYHTKLAELSTDGAIVMLCFLKARLGAMQAVCATAQTEYDRMVVPRAKLRIWKSKLP